MILTSEAYPFISIITVSLNASGFIEQTIQSVLNQTYPNLEYVIIDGGSVDGTVNIIQKYESSLSYWHSKPDRGLYHAFNLGLQHARGDWILYLNADDYFWDHRVLERMGPHLKRHRGADVVFGQVGMIPRNGENPEPTAFFGAPWRWPQFRLICTIPHQAALTRRGYFQRWGIFDERWRIAGDYELYLRAGAALMARFVPEVVSVMREGGLSLGNVIPSFFGVQH